MPETMMKEYLQATKDTSEPLMSYIQFTHYIARASLEPEVEEELRNLFGVIDREECGSANAEDMWVFINSIKGS